MKISDITFDLPKELIVKKPNLNKNDNKMMNEIFFYDYSIY